MERGGDGKVSSKHALGRPGEEEEDGGSMLDRIRYEDDQRY